jgi:hypothetical protein
MYQEYRANFMEMLNDPRTIVMDYTDHISFNLVEKQEIAVLRLADEQCDYYVDGLRKAVFIFSRNMKLVALKRALLEGI